MWNICACLSGLKWHTKWVTVVTPEGHCPWFDTSKLSPPVLLPPDPSQSSTECGGLSCNVLPAQVTKLGWLPPSALSGREEGKGLSRAQLYFQFQDAKTVQIQRGREVSFMFSDLYSTDICDHLPCAGHSIDRKALTVMPLTKPLPRPLGFLTSALLGSHDPPHSSLWKPRSE